MTDRTRPLDQRSLALRRMALESLVATGGGHVGASFSSMEIMRVLYDTVAQHRPTEPRWPDRDRIILSKGHGCLSQYVLLADHGYFDPSELAKVGKRDAMLGGHPEWGLVPGIEFSTGSLGHGLSAGVGMALELRRQGRSNRVFVVVGDGEVGEGSVWEAVMAAAHHRLSALTLLVDANSLQSAGNTVDILDQRSLPAHFAACGWRTVEVDGHDPDALIQALQPDGNDDRPLALVCHTVKSRGLPIAENVPTWHYRIGFTPEELSSMRQALEWSGQTAPVGGA